MEAKKEVGSLWDEARKVYIKQGGTHESWSYEDIDTWIDCAQKVYAELIKEIKELKSKKQD